MNVINIIKILFIVEGKLICKIGEIFFWKIKYCLYGMDIIEDFLLLDKL